jgi:Ribosome biogenesis protein Nop16
MNVVLLQNRTFQRWDPNPRFGDKTVAKLWDMSKSPSINLANMGLLAMPNQDVERPNNTPVVNADANVIELFDVPDTDTLAVNRKVHPMPEEDQKYIAKCIAKHADDYGKIFRDIKVNNMQYSEAQLRKMGARFLLLDSEQRKVELKI